MLSDSFTWTPKYRATTTTPLRVPIVLAGLGVPDAWAAAPELGRRIAHLRLPTSVSWTRDPDRWRHADRDNARAGDALVAAAKEVARRHAYRFRPAAEELGIVGLDAADPEAAWDRRQALRSLYSYLRGDAGPRLPSPSGT